MEEKVQDNDEAKTGSLESSNSDIILEGDQKNPKSSGDGPTENLVIISEDFDSVVFLEENNLVAVPETSFNHVERSHDTGVRENMIVEMPLVNDQEDKFWLAKVLSVHGALLRLTWVGRKDQKFGNIWLDLLRHRIYPLGWCQMNRKALDPPEEVKRSCPEWQTVALDYLEDISYDTISMHHIDGEGITSVDRLKEGMALDVQNELIPTAFWPAVIVKNSGGLLQLEYVGQAQSKESKVFENLFYTSNRLFPLKYGQRSGNKYAFPTQEFCSNYRPGDVISELEKNEAIRAAPEDLIVPFVPETHHFEKGAQVEVIPRLSSRVETGKVTQTWNDLYFQVTLTSDPSKQILCHQHSDNIYPIGWSAKAFEDDDLKEQFCAKETGRSCRRSSKVVFPDKFKLTEDEFEVGQKLEVFFDNHMRTGSIRKIVDNVVVVQLDSDETNSIKNFVIIPSTSTDIFPFGWAITNDVPLKVPPSFKKFCTSHNVVQDNAIETKESPEEQEEPSSWSPLIYFNYQCYSASFLSKAKLASLPKSVGPGSAVLVMKKVLELIVGSSYKSAAVLKRLEFKEGDKLRKNFVLENIKAKSKIANLKGDIEIPARSDQVSGFLRDVCQKLGACPYLVSTTLYDKECPAACQSKPRTEFHSEEQSGIIFRHHRKRKGRRGLNNESSHENNVPKNSTSSNEDDTDETNTEGPSNVTSRCNSPTNSVTSEPYRKKPTQPSQKSGIRTRGAKLPDFAQKLKMKKSRKDQRDEPKNNDSKITTPSPKRFKIDKMHDDIRRRRRNEMKPPPVRKIKLCSNPLYWTCQETANFLAQSEDCCHLAHFMIQDEIDGLSFMLLTYPIVKEFWSLTTKTAIQLCQHIESVKFAYIMDFMED